MKSENLFRHLETLDNTPVYRNINFRPGESAFTDLLDKDQDYETIKIAQRNTRRVRTNANLNIRPSSDPHYKAAIQRVFQRSIFYPTRYGDGTYPVWYGSMAAITTIYETAYHFIKEEMSLGGHTEPIKRQRVIYKVACAAILIDLTGAKNDFPQLIDSDDYNFTQKTGKRIRNEGHPGLMVPSARHQDGTNIAIFNPSVLTNPVQEFELIYKFTPSTMQLIVSTKSEPERALYTMGDNHLFSY